MFSTDTVTIAQLHRQINFILYIPNGFGNILSKPCILNLPSHTTLGVSCLVPVCVTLVNTH